jgi:hypothetical protein
MSGGQRRGFPWLEAQWKNECLAGAEQSFFSESRVWLL